MKYIHLDNNEVALVDDEDYDFVSSFNKWHINSVGYLATSKMINYDRTFYTMHRIIMERLLGEAIPEGLVIDHKNRNKLDNRRENLRLATYSQNNINSKIPENNTSGHKGIGFHKKRNQWRARIGKCHLGWFETIEEAIEARKLAERIFYSEFTE